MGRVKARPLFKRGNNIYVYNIETSKVEIYNSTRHKNFRVPILNIPFKEYNGIITSRTNKLKMYLNICEEDNVLSVIAQTKDGVIAILNRYVELGDLKQDRFIYIKNDQVQNLLDEHLLNGLETYYGCIRSYNDKEYSSYKVKLPGESEDTIDEVENIESFEDVENKLYNKFNILRDQESKIIEDRLKITTEDTFFKINNVTDKLESVKTYLDFYIKLLDNTCVGDIISLPKNIYDSINKEIHDEFDNLNIENNYRRVVTFILKDKNSVSHRVTGVAHYNINNRFIKFYVMNRPNDLNSIAKNNIKQEFYKWRKQNAVL